MAQDGAGRRRAIGSASGNRWLAGVGVAALVALLGGCQAEPKEPAGPTFCDAAPILGRACSSCHSQEPQFGAPMSLMHRDDFARAAVTDPSKTVAQLVRTRLHDTARPMPPRGGLSTEELALLDQWLDAGRPAGSCAGDVPPSAHFTGEGTDALPCTPDLWVTASAGPTDGTQRTQDGWLVPLVDDRYQCFSVKVPAKPGRQLVAASPVIGDGRLVHHMILYREKPNHPLREGPHGCGLRSNEAVPIMLWGPGAGGLVLPGDVGLDLGDGEVWLDLEVHYNNARRLDGVEDTSGFGVCTIDTPRAQHAQVATLGTSNFTVPAASDAGPGRLTLSNTCAPEITKPTRILATAPHMHGIGRSFRTEILRGADDSVETLIDVPSYDFNNQIAYPVDFTLGPHDALRTSCTWENPHRYPVEFGAGTDDEMCFNFVLYYPAGQLGYPGLPAEACIDPAEVLSHNNP